MQTRTKVIIAAALLTGSLAAHACMGERGHHGGDRAEWKEKRIERMTKKLELTEAQQAQVSAIFDSTEQQFKALRQQGEAIRTASHDSLKEVLTAEQWETFQEEMQDKHAKRKGKWGRHHGHHDED